MKPFRPQIRDLQDLPSTFRKIGGDVNMEPMAMVKNLVEKQHQQYYSRRRLVERQELGRRLRLVESQRQDAKNRMQKLMSGKVAVARNTSLLEARSNLQQQLHEAQHQRILTGRS